ncbi:MAG: Cys-Gln thioester bond-forming surface protein, partial [Erysipelotrichaceae bacterium]|nr:Cys-Gln thioester bond-forming surface protein [Erysipelotrichaceae bacterium]
MRYISKTIRKLLISAVCLFLLLNSGMVSTASAADDAVDEVTQLLHEIDSLQQMQNRRAEFAVTARFNPDDPATVAEHEQMQAGYKAYVSDMFAKRDAAKAAYENLSAEQQAQIDPDLLARLTDTLETTYSTESYPLIPSDNEYNYQIVMITPQYYLAYELSMHCTEDKDMPCTLILKDVSGDETSFTPNGLYSYGTNNYEVTYCCDEREPTVFGVHYKRINIEDCEYYNTAQAEKIRAIILNSYPFISLEEMKANLKEAGVAHAEELDRGDITAAVQLAVWYFSNRMTNAQLEADTTYAYTINALSYRAGGYRPLITSFHDYRNELWYWWNANDAHDWSYDADADARVSALREYLISMPGQKATDNQAVISDVQIVRTGLTDENDGTYSIDMNLIINHSIAAGDQVTMTITTPTETKTIDLTGETVYPTTIRAKYGETVNVTVEGTQHLEKGAYFYEPEGGYDASQALVGVSEGDTKVRAEKSFVFNKDIDSGLHVYKTEAEIGKPLEGIEFSVYDVTGETVSDTPTEEEIAAYAVDEKLAGTMTTDSTGYASLELPYGTYLVIEEPNENVKKPVDPFYVVLPDEQYGDIAELNLINKERDEPGTTSVQFEATKEFNDWGKADSFTFELAAVTEGAPMPQNTTAVATKDNPTAVFDSIKYTEPGTYEYTITEIDDGVEGVTYDTTPHKVVVTVTENKVVSEEDDYLLTSYSLEAETVYDEKESLIITNTFTPAEAEIEVTKLLEGREWLDADSFTVTLSAVDGAPLPKTTELTLTKSAQRGTFGPIEYDKSGTYQYIVRETAGNEEYMEYDVADHMVTVIVTKGENNTLSTEVDYG